MGVNKMTTKGIGQLFMDPDPDTARAFFKDKSRALIDKTMYDSDLTKQTNKLLKEIIFHG